MKMKTLLLSGLAMFAFAGSAIAIVQMSTGETAMARVSGAKAIVDTAIRDGIVGETASGYLALANSSAASSQIIAAMNEINIGRKVVYTRLAEQQNVQIEVVAALTGEKQLAGSARGTKIMNKQGMWVTVR